MGNNEDTNEYEKKKESLLVGYMILCILLDCQLPKIDRLYFSPEGI